MTSDINEPSPTVRRRRLAAELRRLREASGFTHGEVARRLEWSPSKMTRIEGAQFVRMPGRDVRDLLDVYGVTDEGQREALVTLARESRKRGWWAAYSDAMPETFHTYVGLEAEAATIRIYQSELVPGLLQTEAYVRSLNYALRPDVQEEVLDSRVAARLGRQSLLDRPDPPKLWVVLNEAVIRRPVGGREVMRDQLYALVEASRRPHVTIQVLPFAAGPHAGMEGTFTVLGFREPMDTDVAYVEGLMGDVYLENVDEVERCHLAFDHVRASAIPPAEAQTMITEVAKEM